MKMLTALLAVLLLIGTAHAAPTNVVTPPSCYSDLESLPVYKLDVTHKTDMGNNVIKWTPNRGSVFLVEKDFWITAAHVMQDGKVSIGIIRDGDIYIEAELVYVDVGKDIAILYGPSGDRKPLPIMMKPLKQGEAVWSVGFPGVAGNLMVSFEGSALAVSQNGSIVASALVLPGMSGGPLFRCNGRALEVSGTISSYATERLSGISTNEDGTETHYIININTGSSYSSPRLRGHLSKGMARQLEILEAQQNELQNQINN